MLVPSGISSLVSAYVCRPRNVTRYSVFKVLQLHFAVEAGITFVIAHDTNHIGPSADC